MDFFSIRTKENKDGSIRVYPNFLVGRSKDLMVKAKSFYAIWDERRGLWSTDEYDVQRLVDEELYKYTQQNGDAVYDVKYMRNFDSDQWTQFRRYVQNVSDNAHILDDKLVFANQETAKEDYATKKLPYPLEKGSTDAWDEMMSTLYSEEERRKIEWSIGSIVAGDSRYIQKFLVLYGPSGTGKSTVLDIIDNLFQGYTAKFDAKALGQGSNAFSTEVFKNNPLVAIQHDGDLSKIDDNTKLNSIVSHEEMIVNEKFKPSYATRINAFLYMGTNQPVKISDAKSGLIRRLIDVEPTGKKLPYKDYMRLKKQVEFEYGAIAKHCYDLYSELGIDYYNDYRPIEMMFQTDHFLNFVHDSYDVFKTQDYTTSKQAYILYKTYCEEYGIDRMLPKQKFNSELSNYFDSFHERLTIGDQRLRSVYQGFNLERFKQQEFEPNKEPTFRLEETESIFDKEYSDQPAQLTTTEGTPRYKWTNVTTKLSDIDTKELHYVKVPKNHIIIDFDLKDENGDKSLEKNLAAAADWPKTYAELSKSGAGVHLHYIFDGDPETLDNLYSKDIEVKVYTGNASLRRKLSKCNNQPIAHISSGLPIKEKKVLSEKSVRNEKNLRNLIERNLRKEIHPGTKPSVMFIRKILDDAYEDGLVYDLTDMRSPILTFASKSTNHMLECIKEVQHMKFKSEESTETESADSQKDSNDALVFYDIEVYPNLLLVVYKERGEDKPYMTMINPSPAEVEMLLSKNLIGFNNRRYDNHVLYGRMMGYDNEAVYHLSQNIVNNNRKVMFGEAYNASYADIYDFASKKQSLKKWELELGLPHVEMDHPWDQPLPDERLEDAINYCKNDVYATEMLFEHLSADFMARRILADLSGLSVNHTTQAHTAKIIFGNDREPQSKFLYTNLATGERSDGHVDEVKFDGYEYDYGKSTYMGETVGEGGYVYSEPGVYDNVALIDVASMHPNSIRNLELFGPYTKNFTDLVDARVAIKRRDFEQAREMLDGRLAPYLKDESQAKNLAYALKIVINIVYGLTSATFTNKFKDNRNKDNIVAKRGALFMIDLKYAVQEKGYNVAHIKTDSIKIPDADQEIIDFVIDFGKEYGYEFEHEATYEKMALVNDAVYVAKDGDKWSATGAMFQHPYVFKTMFSGEPVEMADFVENRSVAKGHIYLGLDGPESAENRMVFIGKTGQFVPVIESYKSAATPLRVYEDKRYAVAGTKGHKWTEARLVVDESLIDRTYAEKLAEDAKKAIENVGSYDELIN